jgi:DNA-binding NarL/FixJ family response regulator
MTHVLIVDDHELVRRGLRDLLAEAFRDLDLGEAANAAEALDMTREKTWDVILVDINLPTRSGLELLQELRADCPRVPAVVLSAFPEREYAIRAFKLGAAAYISKQSASAELIVAIRKALAGGRYITPSLAEQLAATVAGESPAVPHELLSTRELQVLRLIAQGLTLKEIAARLSLSEKTIGTYRARISEKMSLATNVDLTRYAVQHKLID